MGFRDLSTVNKATDLKLAWKIVTLKNQWDNWMRARYLKDSNFQVSKIDNNALTTWKCILKFREKLSQLVERKIANGLFTCVWFDPWMGSSNLIDDFGWYNYSSYRAKGNTVAEIISDGLWKANNLTITSGMANKINSIPIYSNLIADIWAWNITTYGNFLLKTTYESCKD